MNNTLAFILALIILSSSAFYPLVISPDFITKKVSLIYPFSMGILVSFIFMEQIPHASHTSNSGLLFTIGFGLSTILSLFLHHHHDHPHESLNNCGTHHHCHHEDIKKKKRRSSTHRSNSDSLNANKEKGKKKEKENEEEELLLEKPKVKIFQCKKSLSFLIMNFFHNFSDAILLVPIFLKSKFKPGFLMTFTFLLHDTPIDFTAYTIYAKELKTLPRIITFLFISISSYIFTFLFFISFKIEYFKDYISGFGVLVSGFFIRIVFVDMLGEMEGGHGHGHGHEHGNKEEKVIKEKEEEEGDLLSSAKTDDSLVVKKYGKKKFRISGRVLKNIFFILGMVCMAIIMRMSEGIHSHDHHDCHHHH